MSKSSPYAYLNNALAFSICCLAVLMNGCSKEPTRLQLHKTTGQITVSGASVAGVAVTLNPTKETANAVGALHPHGASDASGNFTLTTYVAGDGAPEGEWLVTLNWPNPEISPEVRTKIEADGDTAPDRLGGQFSVPENSPWKVKTGPSISQIPTIDLP